MVNKIRSHDRRVCFFHFHMFINYLCLFQEYKAPHGEVFTGCYAWQCVGISSVPTLGGQGCFETAAWAEKYLLRSSLGAFRQARWMAGRLVRTFLFYELGGMRETWLARWWVGRD